MVFHNLLFSFYFGFSTLTMSVITLISPRLNALNKSPEDLSKSEISAESNFNLASAKYFGLFYIMNTLIYRFIFEVVGTNMLYIHLSTIIISQFLGRKLRIIGITGQISTGKSSVSKYLITKGFTVIDIDKLNKEVLDQNNVKDEIRLKLGEECFIPNTNELNKLNMRKIIYSDASKKHILEKITHMRVLFKFLKSVLYYKLIKFEKHLFVENSILLKINFMVMICYPIISILSSNNDMLVKRIIQRDNVSEDVAKKIINNQMSSEEYAARSDYIIDNSGNMDDLESKVNELIKILN